MITLTPHQQKQQKQLNAIIDGAVIRAWGLVVRNIRWFLNSKEGQHYEAFHSTGNYAETHHRAFICKGDLDAEEDTLPDTAQWLLSLYDDYSRAFGVKEHRITSKGEEGTVATDAG